MKNIKKSRVHPMVIMDSVITGFRLFGIFMILALKEQNWKYYLLLTIASLSSITYLYYLYQFVKESQ